MRINIFSFNFNRGVLLAFLVILMVSVSSILVLADLTGVTLTSPADSESISGTHTLSATITGSNADNATFYFWNQTSSAWQTACSNATAGTAFTCNFDTTVLVDGTAHDFPFRVQSRAEHAVALDNASTAAYHTPYPILRRCQPCPIPSARSSNSSIASSSSIEKSAHAVPIMYAS